MAKRSNKSKDVGLPRDTRVELVGTHPKHPTKKKEMTYGQALNIEKIKGWNYIIYQLGFSQFNLK